MDWRAFSPIILAAFAMLPVVLFTIADLFWRSDLGTRTRLLWVLGIVLLPFIGTLAYLLSRPPTAAPSVQRRRLMHELIQLDVMHGTGDISNAEYEARREAVLAANRQRHTAGTRAP